MPLGRRLRVSGPHSRAGRAPLGRHSHAARARAPLERRSRAAGTHTHTKTHTLSTRLDAPTRLPICRRTQRGPAQRPMAVRPRRCGRKASAAHNRRPASRRPRRERRSTLTHPLTSRNPSATFPESVTASQAGLGDGCAQCGQGAHGLGCAHTRPRAPLL